MPTQVLPITDIASLGVIEDTPSFSLPPNAFSDVQNVRFRDNAVRKMLGEEQFLTDDDMINLPDIRYVAYWPSPSGARYIVVTNVRMHVYNTLGVTLGSVEVMDSSNWQHTLFNGGFHIILNGGVETPVYITDGGVDTEGVDNSVSIVALPGWDSYAVEETVSDFIYDGSMADFTIEDPRLVSGSSVRFEVTPRNISSPIRTTVLGIDSDGNLTPDGTVIGLGTASLSGTILTFTPVTDNGGASIRITVSSAPVTSVTAGVIRAYGNLLVAGNLREAGGRTLTGTVRTSDVAGPGEIPRNWNPFRLGVNTADEFTLSTTGTIQDLVELQGNLYVYTDSSIHAIQQTGGPTIPFQITPVTDNYGVDNTGGVLEVDGKHIVVGSDDVYVFSGHPGSIQSIVDMRVRHADGFFRENSIQIVRFSRYDELWFWTPGNPLMYIWNYRNNTWTKRSQSTPVSGTESPMGPLFNTDTQLYTVDSTSYTDLAGASYEAYVERLKMALAPEFDTEMLASIAFLVSGNGQLNIQVVGSNNTGGVPPEFAIPNTRFKGGLFDIDTEYKQDIREHGRFLNYRMTHVPASSDIGFDMTGFQLDIGKGGTR